MEVVTTRPACELREEKYTGLAHRPGRNLPYAVWLRGRIVRWTRDLKTAQRIVKGLIKDAEVMRKPPLMDALRKQIILRS